MRLQGRCAWGLAAIFVLAACGGGDGGEPDAAAPDDAAGFDATRPEDASGIDASSGGRPWDGRDYEPPTPTTPCGEAGWCYAPEVCIDGECQPCVRSGSARRAAECCSGSLDPLTGECTGDTLSCRDDADCGWRPGSSCRGGVCRFPPPGEPCPDGVCALGECIDGMCPECALGGSIVSFAHECCSGSGNPTPAGTVRCDDYSPVGRGCVVGVQCANGACGYQGGGSLECLRSRPGDTCRAAAGERALSCDDYEHPGCCASSGACFETFACVSGACAGGTCGCIRTYPRSMAACLSDDECCSGRCERGICACTPAGEPAVAPEYFEDEEENPLDIGESIVCCSGRVDGALCAPGNGRCVSDAECLSGSCDPGDEDGRICDCSTEGAACAHRDDCCAVPGVRLTCEGGVCSCLRRCDGRSCGPDGCGGTCGTCATGTMCDETTGACRAICTPSCAGRECGSNGCGGTCGRCIGGGSDCSDGSCVEVCRVTGSSCDGDPPCCDPGARCQASALASCSNRCCRSAGRACASDDQCCSNDCAGGVCSGYWCGT
ncbi:Hypothetical protein I5071_70080 [Sandaracinus amylolyticus]|nr:Hypothetical protein I5071_70080 [Sandaracinus amylolyticus]